MKRDIAFIASLLAVALACVGCGGGGKSSAQEIYFLNYKPEISDVYPRDVKPAFEAENPGYTLKVVTAASGSHEQTLKNELAKSTPPDIFHINGHRQLEGLKDYASDISDTQFYALLSDKSMAITYDGVPVGVPYAIEGYGIIYNDAIMRAYFALPNKAVSINSAEEITDFATLKAVVEDMQANASALGINGVFAPSAMAAGNQWPLNQHAVNVPLFFEFKDLAPDESSITTGLASSTISFKYGDNYKALVDLYTNNCTTPKSLLGSKTIDDAMAEFALGQCAMVQNGNWSSPQIIGVKGSKVAAEDIKYLPIYMGIPGESDYGLCVGTETYLAINKNASPEARQAADLFLTWLFSSATGKKIVSEKLMFITPFSSFAPDEFPPDPLSREVGRWMNKPGVESIEWTLNAFPTVEWKDGITSALLKYFDGADWSVVVDAVVNGWTTEWNLVHGRNR